MGEEDDGAQFDTGDDGQKAEDAVDDLIDVESDAQAVFWYGIACLSTAGASALVINALSDSTSSIGSALFGWKSKDFWMDQIFFFLPVGVSWLFISFFDTDLMRTIFKDLVAISLAGPFFFNWILLGRMLGYADTLWRYLAFAIYSAVNIFEMIVQMLVVPRVFDYIDE